MTGTIKSVVIDRGFGFISRPGGSDVFFHCRDLDRSLPFDETLQERRVSFGIIDGAKGPRAIDVRPAD